MNIDDLLAGKGEAQMGTLQDCIEELIVDREEPIPSDIRLQARKCMKPQPPVVWDELIEMVYADRENCGPITLQIASAAAVDFVRGGFLGKAERMDAISVILKRQAGLPTATGTSWPDPEDDPEIDPRYVEVEEVAPVTDPAPPAKKKKGKG